MTHIGKIVLLKYDNYKRITYVWNRKTIYNNKNDLNNVLLDNITNPNYFINTKDRIIKKSYKLYAEYKEKYIKIGYIFWDCYTNKLYYNKYYKNEKTIKESQINNLNNIKIKEVYIKLDKEDEGYTIE